MHSLLRKVAIHINYDHSGAYFKTWLSKTKVQHYKIFQQMVQTDFSSFMFSSYSLHPIIRNP